MPKQSRDIIKTWFETGDYPTQQQFWDFIDSVLFPGEVAIGDVVGLLTALQQKAAINHTHSAEQITSGQLAAERIATGAPAAGYIPVFQVDGTVLWKQPAEGGIVEEVDPVWAAEKGNYYTKTEADAQFLESETDPVWESEKANYYTKIEADAQFLETETDPVWTAEKGNYQTAAQADAKYLQSETDPVWNAEKPNYQTTAQADAKYLQSETDPNFTANGVPKTRTITINGTTYDLSDNREWTIAASGGGGSSFGTASGTNTYTVACTPTVTALTTGLCIRVLFTNGNTGASTINVDGLGVKNIYKGASTALASGAIQAGQIFELYYDGTVWQLGSVQVVPTTPNKVITTDSAGTLQAVNDLIDINSTTTEATLIAATWTNGTATATGTPGTWVLGTTSNYLYICTGTNSWIRIPAFLDYVDVYLGTVSDSGGVKTSAQMAALYPNAIRGQYAIGAAGKYEYMGLPGWFYFANTITP